MLSSLMQDYNIDVGLDIADLAKETAGFVLGDLVHLVSSGYDIAFSSLLQYWYVVIQFILSITSLKLMMDNL